MHAHMHMRAHAHMHMHKHAKHDKHGCLHVSSHLQFLYMCVCVCVHVCVHVLGVPPPPTLPSTHPPTLPSTHPPPPRAAGSSKQQNSMSLELIEIIQFCLKILYL